jgi:hypothetical protein
MNQEEKKHLNKVAAIWLRVVSLAGHARYASRDPSPAQRHRHGPTCKPLRCNSAVFRTIIEDDTGIHGMGVKAFTKPLPSG